MKPSGHPYGHFQAGGSEFVVTRPDTPRAFDNFLWNDSIQSNVWQTGVGYCDYQIGDEEGVQLFSGVGRTCDVEVFGRQHLMSRLIYVRDNETGEFWNVGWEPVRKPAEDFSCTHGLGYTIISSRNSGIDGRFRIFVPLGTDPVELWTIGVANASDRPRSLSLFVYSQIEFKYKWGFDSYGSAIYRSVRFDEALNAVIASKHPYLKPHGHLTAFFAADRPIDAYDGSQEKFLGVYNSLQSPAAVERGRLGNSRGTFEATIAALQFDIALVPGEEREVNIVLGVVDAEEAIGRLKDRYLRDMENDLRELKESRTALFERNRVSTPDANMDALINHWSRQANLFGSRWCRWGYMGYRDIVQQGYGIAGIDGARTRRILLDALGRQYANGLAIRGWNPVDVKQYSDSALWLAFTLCAYLRESGDLALLGEKVPFYDGGEASVREHVDKALDFLEGNKGSHGLCLIKFGDWNDSLTSVGKEGRGESVWLSQAYVEAMRQMAALALFLGEKDKAQGYLDRGLRMKDTVNDQAWDGEWYLRCFDDEGQPVGSKVNDQASIFMETQCWALISGLADKRRAEALIASMDERLGTDLGYLLLAPTYTRLEERVGRISSMEPGIAENGTIYSHLNAWMIMGLLRLGMADKAYELFKKISPAYCGEEGDPKRLAVPYMYANSYSGPDHHNKPFEMEYTWITGSVAWFGTIIPGEMLGVDADYEGLRIKPCIPSSWKECSLVRRWRGADYHVVIRNPSGLQGGGIDLVIDGRKMKGNLVPAFADGNLHEVCVTLVEVEAKDPAEAGQASPICD
jgi:cellobiose phosphorylase